MVWYIPSRSRLDAWLQARLGGLLALVGAPVRRPRRLFDASCAATLSDPWSGITTVLIQMSAKLTQRPRLSAAFRLCFPGKTRGTPLLACPCQDSPGAPHRPVLPGWSPLFAGSPRPIPHRGAPASLATALAQGGKWSLHASPLPLRGPL
jgi:hypothetical protein